MAVQQVIQADTYATSYASSTLFDRLSDELIMDVLKGLDSDEDDGIHDICNARLACRRFARVGATVLKNLLQWLFVEATPESLRRFKAICTHPIFSQGITRVVFSAATYQQPILSVSDFNDDASTKAIQKQLLLPPSVLKSAHASHVHRFAKQAAIISARSDVLCLIKHLPLLPRLYSLMLELGPTFDPERPFNQPSWQLITPFPHEDSIYDDEVMEATWKVREKLTVSQLADIHFELNDLRRGPQPRARFRAHPLHPVLPVLTALSATQKPNEACLAFPFTTPLQSAFAPTTTRMALRDIKELVFSVECSDMRTFAEEKREAATRWTQLMRAATSITTLSVSVESGDGCTLIDELFSDGRNYWPNLRRLAIFHDHLLIPHNHVAAHTTGAHTGGHLQTLLRRHQSSLTEIYVSQGRELRDDGEYIFATTTQEVADFRHFCMHNVRNLMKCDIVLAVPESHVAADNADGSENDDELLQKSFENNRDLRNYLEATLIETGDQFDSLPRELAERDNGRELNLGFKSKRVNKRRREIET